MTASFITQLAIASGKLTARMVATLRLGAGTSLPGKVARKLDPNLLQNLCNQLTGQTIAVTGTNGKTTTCGLLAHILSSAGTPVVHNQLGANMVPGITAALLRQTNALGTLPAQSAVLEVDEASLKGLANEASINTVMVTNLFRDQLDRYGELDTTARLITEGIQKTVVLETGGLLILNADDPLVTSIAHRLGIPLDHPNLRFFGVNTVTYEHEANFENPVPFNAEVAPCPACQMELAYHLVIYGHLGHYYCKGCGFERPTPHVQLESIHVSPDNSVCHLMSKAHTLTDLSIPLPGLFNVYNALSALACYDSILETNTTPSQAMAPAEIQDAINTYKGVFGRAEEKVVDGKRVKILLIKNPVGASEVLKLVAGDPNGELLIALNDNYADGRDVSWIWDAEFERIPADKKITVSGTRAYDMATRLKYAGVWDENITVIDELKTAVKRAIETTPVERTLYIIPTYTALLDLRFILP